MDEVYKSIKELKEKIDEKIKRIVTHYENYALEALNLMSEKCYRNGIKALSFLIESNNVPSIKTVEKFGATIIEQNNDVVHYEINLEKIFENSKPKGI